MYAGATAVTCPPPDIRHAVSNATAVTSWGERVWAECEPGFRLDGTAARGALLQCLGEGGGVWAPANLSCLRESCCTIEH
jgi:hypothetical protein